jgi:hypothetical protein
MSANEADPKTTANEARRMPETEKVLRQFLSLESGNYASPNYRRGYGLAFGEKKLLKQQLRCKHDGYIATTLEELEWHEGQCHHDADHDFEPYDPPPPLPTAEIWCTHCGGRHFDRGEWRQKLHHKHRCEYCKKLFEGPEAVGV